jgi:glycosyltransferase involved in cell wall biosynthesis
MKKVVYINGRFLGQKITGVQRYAIELTKALDGMLDKQEYNNSITFVLLVPPGDFNKLPLSNIKIKQLGCLSGHFWEQFELSIFTFGHLLLNFCNTGPIVKRNQIVTICDASVFSHPEGYSKLFRLWYKCLIPILGIMSRRVITISEFSKAELISYCHIKPKKIAVTLLGAPERFDLKPDTAYINSQGLGSTPFVLTVSSMNPNKNFAGLLKSIALLKDGRFQVVIVGGVNSKIFGANLLQIPDFVKYLGYVSDSELQQLYAHASCFVYPSFYEGFGLPPLEAMAAGCPVITSNVASLPEVCGSAVLYCDPTQPSEIASKINLMMSNSSLRSEMRKRGFKRIKQFTWDKCALETYNVIKSVVFK